MANWLDKYEQGGLVLKQKTKDNYGKKANPNNPDVSFPPGFKGLAYNTKGRNYSPAWGGQFAMGGSLPGATGMMYARTINPAPSNGPYAKKTKASAQDGKKLSYNQWKKQYNLKETPDYNLKRAWELGYTPDKTGHLPTVDNQTGQFLKAKGHPTLQLELDWYNSPEAADFRSKNIIDSSGKFFKYVPKSQNGQEMKYYQAGLDFKPKTISQDGDKIYNEKNIKAKPPYNYPESDPRRHGLFARNPNKRELITVSDPNDPRLKAYQDSLSLYNKYMLGKQAYDKYTKQLNLKTWKDNNAFTPNQKIQPVSSQGFYYPGDGDTDNDGISNFIKTNDNREIPLPKDFYNKVFTIGTISNLHGYKKPVQPVILQEEPKLERPIPISRETRNLGFNLPKPGVPSFPKLNEYNPDTPTKFSFTSPTGKYNEQKTMYFPTKSALKAFAEGIRGATYQEGDNWASATGNYQDGGNVDPMGYWNPENWGKPVTIPSNEITMEGVYEPLIGISDTGDVQYMEPGEDYEFDGEYVTEYPVARGGVSVNNADAQPIEKLDQLLNFTNYNKPTKGGWLDKYQ